MVTIIGHGHIGKTYQRILTERGVEFNICDYSPEKAQDVHMTSHLDPAINASDTIILATPPFNHFELTTYFINLGKNVVVEKPPVMNWMEFDAIEKHFPADNIYYSYHTSFNPNIVKATGEFLGRKLKKISVVYKEDAYLWNSPWVFEKEVAGGGCLIDSGINILSVLDPFIGKINFGKVELLKRRSEVEDQMLIEGIDENGIALDLSIDWINPEETRKYTFEFRDGGSVMVDLASGLIVNNGNIVQEANRTMVDQYNEYWNMTTDFLDFFNHHGDANRSLKQLNPIRTVLNAYDFSSKVTGGL